jgi:phosphoribosylanthranilate isomerase
MTRVKICGVTEPFHALVAAEAGAAMVGVVFAESRRKISVEQARMIAQALKERHLSTEVVGLFVNRPAAEMNRVANQCGLDAVQLSGNESWELCQDVEKPVIKAVRVKPGMDVGGLLAHLHQGMKSLGEKRLRFLVDANVEGSYGGTGATADWDVAGQLAAELPIILAGGLTVENVGQATEQVKPWGVDVSSGVETDGIKDATKIRNFLDAVRKADRRLHSSA